MMGSSGEPWGYYPQDSNGLAVQSALAEPCACPVYMPTQVAVCSPLGDGGCAGERCEEAPNVLPPVPSHKLLGVRIPIWGHYCGSGHGCRGPIPPCPRPIDEVDACCREHDICYGQHDCDTPCWWVLKCACRDCDIRLGLCAAKADCSRSPNPRGCAVARIAIEGAMAITASRNCLIPLPPYPIPTPPFPIPPFFP